MADYPLIFKLTNDVRGNGFLARVISYGRALMTHEEGEWWCFGVEPGGLAEHGQEPPGAFDAFKTTYARILQDVASESATYEAFVAGVEAFISDKDRIETSRWERARQDVRAGKNIEAPFSGLPRNRNEINSSVTVTPLRHIEASQQEVVELAEAA